MGTIFKNKNKIDKASLVENFVSGVKNNASEQFSSFVDLLQANGFVNSIASVDLTETLEDNDFNHLPLMNNNKISIGVANCCGSQTVVGIDPTKYFNKISQCAILAYFPMSKNDYKIFENILKKILEEKSCVRKRFLEGNFRYGSFYKFV